MVIRYIRMYFRLVAPLSIGSGNKMNSDHDVVLDSSNTPIIPATAFAGVIRHAFGETGKSTLFGYILNEKESEEPGSAESKIRFYDAVPCDNEKWTVSIRDMVALERKVGKNTGKFDMEIVEPRSDPGAMFSVLFELDDTTEEETTHFLQTLSGFDAGILRLGFKTSRGYGQIGIVRVLQAVFDMDTPDGREDYIRFKPFDLPNTDPSKPLDQQKIAPYEPVNMENYKYTSRYTHIHLELELRGAISIRSYTAKSANIGQASYEQLTLSDHTPVIPGTTWAGAFRDRFTELAAGIPGIDPKKWADAIFGFVFVRQRGSAVPLPAPQDRQKRSGTYFSESRITGHSHKFVTRNAIGRFTCIAKDKALYTEDMYYWGSCGLDIMLGRDIPEYEKALAVLRAVICDLDRGYLAIGGLTSVGRGLFGVNSVTIDGKDETDRFLPGKERSVENAEVANARV